MLYNTFFSIFRHNTQIYNVLEKHAQSPELCHYW